MQIKIHSGMLFHTYIGNHLKIWQQELVRIWIKKELTHRYFAIVN